MHRGNHLHDAACPTSHPSDRVVSRPLCRPSSCDWAALVADHQVHHSAARPDSDNGRCRRRVAIAIDRRPPTSLWSINNWPIDRHVAWRARRIAPTPSGGVATEWCHSGSIGRSTIIASSISNALFLVRAARSHGDDEIVRLAGNRTQSNRVRMTWRPYILDPI